LWDEICLHYDTGISEVEAYQKTWAGLKPYVSTPIFNEVTKKLDIQKNDAEWWCDACVGYFQHFSKKDLPAGVRPLNMPIDSVQTKSVLSDRYGMPTHDENNKPVLVTNRRFRPGGPMSSGGPVPGERPRR
jgi:alpha-glucuronidase